MDNTFPDAMQLFWKIMYWEYNLELIYLGRSKNNHGSRHRTKNFYMLTTNYLKKKLRKQSNSIRKKKRTLVNKEQQKQGQMGNEKQFH
jgi:hypothetical protein